MFNNYAFSYYTIYSLVFEIFCKKVSITQKKCLSYILIALFWLKQGRKRPLDTPKKMIERREREGEREKER